MGGSRKECQRKRREGKEVKGKKGKERKRKGNPGKGRKRGRKELNLGVEGKPWSPVSQRSKEERDNEVR